MPGTEVRWAVLGSVLLLLTACGIPQPFRHQAYAPQGNPLVTLRSGVGVAVPPVLGVPRALGELMAEAVARRLTASDIPAMAVESPAADAPGLVLVGWLVGQDATDIGTSFTVRWSLLASDGTVIDETTRDMAMPIEVWATGGEQVADLVAGDSRAPLVALIGSEADTTGRRRTARDVTPDTAAAESEAVAGEGDASGDKAEPDADTADATATASAQDTATRSSSPGPARSASELVMAPPEVTRAPGNGKEALERALTRIFEQSGVRITETASPDRLVVRGAVEVLPMQSLDTEQVSIAWEVLDGSGQTLGRMSQENAIPIGSLDGEWGDVAALIAEGTAMGVGEILVRKGIVVPPGS
ncbi:hypothetical protein [Rhodospira trueperi]|uniref:Uncharacterized protein n=1 Tax=Rhodospira trueperi TaxID=69960 RepID=A0A1G7E2J3_9PROT|nr:hypothetical protein [Rhodospira trueperi]SDE57706.1 hypothetical protein SAMN05421720_108135 [Rhodospira trueperi]